MNFSSFGLKHDIIRAIDQLGFERATRIQEKAILRMLTSDTDVVARGLDVDAITHVINYNLPDEPDRYTHHAIKVAKNISMLIFAP